MPCSSVRASAISWSSSRSSEATAWPMSARAMAPREALRAIAFEHVEVDAHDSERRAHLVRGIGGELAQRDRALGPRQQGVERSGQQQGLARGIFRKLQAELG
jgi:hypothetical protein